MNVREKSFGGREMAYEAYLDKEKKHIKKQKMQQSVILIKHFIVKRKDAKHA